MRLAYSQAYHAHCKLTLTTGREIILTSLRQQQTYSGLLEGVPDSEMNDREIEATIADARAWCIRGGTPLLSVPDRRDFLRVPGDMSSSRSGRRIPEWLPMVSSIGRFNSSPARDSKMHGATLTVVWFQAEFGRAMAENVLSSLMSMDWNTHARDFEL
jgi:hypothetical protein